MKKIVSMSLLATLCAATSLPALAAGEKIGLLMSDLRLERWQKDRDLFTQAAESMGAEVYTQSANGDVTTQISQIENMISRGVDVLVIVPENGEVLGNVLAEAKAEGIKVLAYDRLIKFADIDLYVSFDNIRVGEMQAEALLGLKPTGNYFLMGGSPTDNNAKMFRQGQMNVLQPAIDAKKINVVGDQWAMGWSAEAALNIMENGLTANANKIDAVVASNDSTAGGAIQALAAQGLSGKVVISGQDADLAAVRRIVAGTQTMTVYKPISSLAKTSAEMAVKLARGENIQSNGTVNNGTKEVNAVLLAPIAVTKDNLDATVIADGFHSRNDVYNP
ncbi:MULTISPECIES: D-xylose ABC transporter substrate-binding protein [Marinomonas]|uniref:D-xylose-binding periplasmic protein n=1 Tax=Marinomonas arctica TaxID=383750 RepID=A0A7H1JAT0_9GAMM|nr:MULTISPECIES: D-xylose ABC transporter substrate-binding protein [Marinomonas]MCS7486894.1 D-xylose transporter subunit XylF [Marinomonas sp. BSi20414]QNT07596.1 D-xylose ABC transporter substrate-binding protein [Marinomonas arctica]GGN21141.1 xylose ABC transporter substrate-binding protein [Marinomonas arctica]